MLASLDEISTKITTFASLDANGMENELFRKKIAYPYEKSQTIESLCKTLKLGREDYFSAIKQSFPDFQVIIRTQTTVVKKAI